MLIAWRRVLQSSSVLEALGDAFALDQADGLATRIADARLRRGIEGTIDPAIIGQVAHRTGRTLPDTESALIDLSLDCALLPEEALLMFSASTTASGAERLLVNALVNNPSMAARVDRFIVSIDRQSSEAARHLVEANLRLVVSLAKRYVGQGVDLFDLVQEGNIGLIRAVPGYDHRRGLRFSTYATFWIRQALSKAIANQGHAIRVPLHVAQTIRRFIRMEGDLAQKLGRDPTQDEVTQAMGLTAEKVEEVIRAARFPISLEAPVGEDRESSIGDFVVDGESPAPDDTAARELLRRDIAETLSELNTNERRVVTLRFGLADGRGRTLEEVGQEMHVSRERIKQIETRALRKLRNPRISRKLRGYLE